MRTRVHQAENARLRVFWNLFKTCFTVGVACGSHLKEYGEGERKEGRGGVELRFTQRFRDCPLKIIVGPLIHLSISFSFIYPAGMHILVFFSSLSLSRSLKHTHEWTNWFAEGCGTKKRVSHCVVLSPHMCVQCLRARQKFVNCMQRRLPFRFETIIKTIAD